MPWVEAHMSSAKFLDVFITVSYCVAICVCVCVYTHRRVSSLVSQLLYTSLRGHKQWVFLLIPKTSTFLSFQAPKPPGFKELDARTCSQWEQPFGKTRVMNSWVGNGDPAWEQPPGKKRGWNGALLSRVPEFDNRKTVESPLGRGCQGWVAALQSQRPDLKNLKTLILKFQGKGTNVRLALT